MMTNVGVIERVLRFGLGLALLAWAHGNFGPALPEHLAWVVFSAGAFLTFTGLFRFCPFYAVLDMTGCAPGAALEDNRKRRL